MEEMVDLVPAGEDVAVCPSCGERNLPRAKYCMTCGARMVVDSGERRMVTVLFADLSGFTSYSETVDPEQVRAVAHEAAASLSGIVRRYGGTMDKVIGDCVMAIYGAPVGHEDDPERAVRSALDMQAFVTEHADRFAGLGLSIGVHTGEAIYAPVGPHGEYTVLGDTVNTAARLQSAASRGEILIGGPTWHAVTEAVEAFEVPPVVAKGKQEPVPAWRPVGVKDEPRARRRAPATPLVGRARELAQLTAAYERARTKRVPHLVTLIGAPGIGKSRLIAALTEHACADGTVLRGGCLDYGEGITYWPVIQMVRQVAGVLTADAPEEAAAKVGSLLDGCTIDDPDELRTIHAALAILLGIPGTALGAGAVEDISRGELHWGLRRLFELLARQRPLTLIVEDLHWAETTLLDWLGYLLRGTSRVPLLVLASARPELRDREPPILQPSETRTVLELGALGDDAGEELLAGLIGEAGRGSMRALLRAAGGNPLYLEELVRMIADEGLLDSGERPIEDVAVPASLHALLDSRIDRLPRLEKRLVGHAAVIGEVFWTGSVAHLDGGATDVERGLSGLEQRDIVLAAAVSTVGEQREYAFKHALLRDVAYQRIPKARRAGQHERCAEWIGAIDERRDEFVEFVAFHLEQACRLAAEVGRSAAAPPILRAVDALTRAGDKANSRQGTSEADRYFARALELVGSRYPETATELRVRRAETRAVLGDLPGAVEYLDTVAEAGALLGRYDLQGRALLELANIEQARGRIAEARRLIARAEEVSAVSDDRTLRVQVPFVRASFRADFDGEIAEAIDDMTEAVRLADRIEAGRLRVEGRLRLGTMLLNAGELARAEDTLTECARLAEDAGSLRHQAAATSFLSFLRYFRGPRDRAEQLALQALAWLERTADSYIQAQTLQYLAMLELEHGAHARAETRLREALVLAERIGGWLIPTLSRYLVAALCRQGRVDEARAAAAAAREHAPPEDEFAGAESSLAEAFVATACGEVGRAREAFGDALGTFERLRMALELADARIPYARSLAAWGDTASAREQLALAAGAAQAMGAGALLEEIERHVAAIGAP